MGTWLVRGALVPAKVTGTVEVPGSTAAVRRTSGPLVVPLMAAVEAQVPPVKLIDPLTANWPSALGTVAWVRLSVALPGVMAALFGTPCMGTTWPAKVPLMAGNWVATAED